LSLNIINVFINILNYVMDDVNTACSIPRQIVRATARVNPACAGRGPKWPSSSAL